MRVARKNMSGLAFVFASENFNQALRRMRYLRQFSRWKDRQSAAIDSKTSELKSQKESLAKTRGRAWGCLEEAAIGAAVPSEAIFKTGCHSG